MCCSSDDLDRTLKRDISEFSEALRGNDGPGFGQISLEFFQKKKRWPFQTECIPWEVWTIRLELIKLTNEHGKKLDNNVDIKILTYILGNYIHIKFIQVKNVYFPKPTQETHFRLALFLLSF